MTSPSMIAATAGWGFALLLWVVTLPGMAVSVPSLGQVHRSLHIGVLVAFLSWLSFPVVAVVSCIVAWNRWTDSAPDAGAALLWPFANGALFVGVVGVMLLLDKALQAAQRRRRPTTNPGAPS